jgi:hypothetical protein
MSTAVNAAVTAGSGAPPAPSASPVIPAESAPSPGAPGSGAGSPPASPESGNIKQLREQYETTKGKLESWDKLGKFDEVSHAYQVYTAKRTECIELGKQLGYDEQEILDSFKENPDHTIAFLQQRQTANSAADPNQSIKQELDKRLKPFEQEREQRRLDEANQLYERTAATEIDKLYPSDKDGKPTISADERDALQMVATEMFKQDPEAMKLLLTEKTSSIAKHIDAAKQWLDKYFLSRTQRESRGISPGQNPTPDPKGKKPTLQEMIDGDFDFKM